MPSSFASHWSLDPEIVFLNHGSYGACPNRVLAHQHQLRQRIERQPVQFFMRDGFGLLDEARECLADFVGARAQDLVFLRNTTEGVNAVVRSLDFAAGDQIIVTNHGYNACRNIVEYVASKTGAEVVVVDLPFVGITEEQVIDTVTRAVTNKTRLAIIDHITSPTGLVLPIAPLTAALQDAGVPVLVDGAHGPGMVSLDMTQLSASWYVGNLHKWVCAPKGAAFMWMNSNVQTRTRPAIISHGYNLRALMPERPGHHLEFDWIGTHDPTAWLSVPAAIEFTANIFPRGWSAVMKRNRALVLEARELIARRLKLEQPVTDSMIGHLAALPIRIENDTLSPLYGSAFQKRLLDKYKIEVPVIPWPDSNARLIRVSAALHNSIEDYAKLADALEKEQLC
ncbi:MAG: aminotransferase class V-fold PLP-dependent enzyme [Bradymonadia bacterium]